MRLLLLLACCAPLFAQLAAPNDLGVSLGHLHLQVADPDAQKKLFTTLLGAEVTHTGTLELLRLPGIYVIAGKARTAPTEGCEGSTVNHIGFLVPSYTEIRAKLKELGFDFAMDNPTNKQVIARFPEKINVEFTEDASLKKPGVMHHIHLSTPDPEKLREWYVKTFGARAGTRGQFLAAFIPGGEVDFRKAANAEAPTKGRSLDHIGFEVKDLEKFCAKLQSAGVSFEMAYRDVPQIGLKIAFLTDPEGTRIELTEGLAGK
jgi:catechol 2,3-dioxygenase-like lactoylglutathione lyase family enzyme